MAPGATVTVPGTLTVEVLLARLTVNPVPVTNAFSVMVQASVPAPVKELDAHVRALTPGPVPTAPVPPSPTAIVVGELSEPSAAELVTVKVPAVFPNACGVKLTFATYVAPDARVIGTSVPLLSEKAVPATTTFEICTGPGLWLISDTAEIVVCPSGTGPKVREDGAALSN